MRATPHRRVRAEPVPGWRPQEQSGAPARAEASVAASRARATRSRLYLVFLNPGCGGLLQSVQVEVGFVSTIGKGGKAGRKLLLLCEGLIEKCQPADAIAR